MAAAGRLDHHHRLGGLAADEPLEADEVAVDAEGLPGGLAAEGEDLAAAVSTMVLLRSYRLPVALTLPCGGAW